MRTRFGRATAAVLTASALCLTAAACGSSDDDKKPASSAGQDTAKDGAGKGADKPATVLTAAQMKAATLAVKDLPAGWKADAAAPATDEAPPKADKPVCQPVADLLADKVAGATMGGGQDFTDAKGFNILSQQVMTFPGTGAADFVKAFGPALDGCTGFKVTGEDGYPVKVEKLAGATAGETSYTFKMTMEIPGFGQGITSHMLVMQQGTGVARLAYVPGDKAAGAAFGDLAKRAGDKFVRGVQG
ncbi:hypothetical protein ACFWU3_11485 [Streptomyces sp. NPDC058685]|uniref:hypothetical protein n=1 Tax=Streptomyces sp. NPDC058685 TaxID=3346598 RepID=UPI00364D2B51